MHEDYDEFICTYCANKKQTTRITTGKPRIPTVESLSTGTRHEDFLTFYIYHLFTIKYKSVFYCIQVVDIKGWKKLRDEPLWFKEKKSVEESG